MHISKMETERKDEGGEAPSLLYCLSIFIMLTQIYSFWDKKCGKVERNIVEHFSVTQDVLCLRCFLRLWKNKKQKTVLADEWFSTK